MSEKIIDLKKIDLLILFGANNRKLYKIRQFRVLWLHVGKKLI